MNEYPTKLELAGDDRLLMEWSDGQKRVYTFRQLREACPCATCREKRNHPPEPSKNSLPILRPEETRPLKIDAMKPVGSYAYSIKFSDGHDTGIFSFELLRELGKDVEE